MALRTKTLRGFSKGLDLASALTNVRDGFTPNAKNMVINEMGGVEKVQGYSDIALSGANLPGAMHSLGTYNNAAGTTKRVIAADADEMFAIESDGTTTRIRATMSTSTRTTFAQVSDTLYACDDINIMGSWTGSGSMSTHAAGADTGPPLGQIIGVLNGIMYTRTVADKMTIRWSDVFNYTSTGAWPTANTVTLSSPNTGASILAGIPTSSGLVVFTDRAMYLLYDQDTGANSVIDSNIQLANPESLCVLDGLIYGMSTSGLFVTDGQSPCRIISQRIDPLLRASGGSLADACSVAFDRKVLTSIEVSGSTNNMTIESYADLVIDKAPAFMAIQYPMKRAVVSSMSGSDAVYFIDASATTKLRKGYTGGDFNTAAITCHYAFNPIDMGNPALEKRIMRVRVVGSGNLSIGLIPDFDTGTPSTQSLNMPTSGGVWNTAVWDAANWGGYALNEGYSRISGRAKSFNIYITESGTTTQDTRPLLGSISGQNVGGASVYLVEPHYAICGRHRTQ